MWASLLLSMGFAIHELIASSSKLDPLIRSVIFAGDFLTIKALPLKRQWARYSAVLLPVIFYAFLAFDADGLTNNDVWHMLAKAPIDLFIISRLFKRSVSKWLTEI
jgi:hypothetical protein